MFSDKLLETSPLQQLTATLNKLGIPDDMWDIDEGRSGQRGVIKGCAKLSILNSLLGEEINDKPDDDGTFAMCIILLESGKMQVNYESDYTDGIIYKENLEIPTAWSEVLRLIPIVLAAD